jgi:hypothetical protein
MDEEFVSIVDYKDSDRFKKLKADMWQRATQGKPFEIKEQSANEYRYFHKLYELYKQVVAKSITSEQASDEDRTNYMRFEFDQRTWERYQFTVMEWNENIKRSDGLRVDFARSKDIGEGYMILAEIVSGLTGDKVLLADAKMKLEVSEHESIEQKSAGAKRT